MVLGCGGQGGSQKSGADGGEGCSEGEGRCEGSTYSLCQGGEWQVANQCPALCDPTLGCVTCEPGRNYCQEDDVHACSSDGQPGGLVESCEGDLHCSGGACVDLCKQASENQSYIGCQYLAVDLDNAIDVVGPRDDFLGCSLQAALQPGVGDLEGADVCESDGALSGMCDADGSCPEGFECATQAVCALDAESAPFAVVVSNPQVFAANVTMENDAGVKQSVQVGAGQVAALFPQDMGFEDQGVRGTAMSKSAYRITSDVPVVAYQFNPLDNVDVFSNDGSLLLPRHSYDTRYYAMTWETIENRPQAKDYNGYIAIVAWQDGTEIAVTPTVDVRPGPSSPGITAGETATFTLDANHVLTLEGAGGGDLTGTLIEGVGGDNAKTFGVLAGHEAVAILSDGADCCADHIEEMMFPVSTWGSEYAVARSQMRSNETDILRIMAQTDGTNVTINPPPATPCPTLGPGEFCEIEIGGDVEISSTEPILVGHYLKSVISLLGGGSGDPSLAIAVPTEQFRDSYTFLVPQEYDKQYISVVASAGAQVILDGTEITGQFSTFGAGTYAAARIEMQPGQHKLSCVGGCGLEVYGYSSAVSYLFAGGLDLERIVVD